MWQLEEIAEQFVSNMNQSIVLFLFSSMLVISVINRTTAQKRFFRWPWTNKKVQNFPEVNVPEEVHVKVSGIQDNIFKKQILHEDHYYPWLNDESPRMVFRRLNADRENFKMDLNDVRRNIEPAIFESAFEHGGTISGYDRTNIPKNYPKAPIIPDSMSLKSDADFVKTHKKSSAFRFSFKGSETTGDQYIQSSSRADKKEDNVAPIWKSSQNLDEIKDGKSGQNLSKFLFKKMGWSKNSKTKYVENDD